VRRVGSFGPLLSGGIDVVEFDCELIETHGTHIEGDSVEVLEVESVTETPSGPIPTLEPDAFANLVRDRLSGHAEIALDFGSEEVRGRTGVVDEERQSEFRRPAFTRMESLMCRDSHLAMQADVDDDASGP
jgi:hypothetical protein